MNKIQGEVSQDQLKPDLPSLLILFLIVVIFFLATFLSSQDREKVFFHRHLQVQEVRNRALELLGNPDQWQEKLADREEVDRRGFELASNFNSSWQDLVVMDNKVYKLLLGPSLMLADVKKPYYPSAWLCPKEMGTTWKCLELRS